MERFPKQKRESITRDMAAVLRSIMINLDDRSLCFMTLYERGYRAAALNECMDDARVMARIRETNEERADG